VSKKYELTDTVLVVDGHTLHRIRALRPFACVSRENSGGFIESEDNLSHDGNCWIYGNTRVFGHARVSGDARIYHYVSICGNAHILGGVRLFGRVKLDHGIWNRCAIIDNKSYLISPTLRKMLISVNVSS